MAQKFPNLGRYLDLQVHEGNKSLQNSIQSDLLQNTIIKLSKDEDKERILKAARGKKKKTLIEGNPKKAVRKFFSRDLAGQKRMGCYILSAERKILPAKSTSPKVSFQNSRPNKDFP